MRSLEDLLKEGWGIAIGLSGSRYWDVTMAQNVLDLTDARAVKATNSGVFKDLDAALNWCVEAMEMRGIKPDRFWDEQEK